MTHGERRSGSDRRGDPSGDKRVRFRLEVALAVEVLFDGRRLAGLARNVSEGGMLVELDEHLPIGAQLEVEMALPGSEAPLSLCGEVRHQVVWQYGSRRDAKKMRAVGIRFIEPRPEALPLTDWIWKTGSVLH